MIPPGMGYGERVVLRVMCRNPHCPAVEDVVHVDAVRTLGMIHVVRPGDERCDRCDRDLEPEDA